MEHYWSPPARSDRLAESLADQLAMVHRIPIGNLTDVMARHVDPHNGRTWLTDIDELEQQLKTMAAGPSMAVSAAIAWMRAHVDCIDDRVAIVHNDTLLHNLLVENDEITAVLDWEMAHIGHPFEDLGYVRPVVEQMTDWNRFLDAYKNAGGEMPASEQINFFTLRALLKLLVQTMHARGAFDSCRTNDLTMAEVGASFIPKLINRLAEQVNNIVGCHVT
jgi:aminoglycoside phosphotransferase (APT) family kinase protein